jgi:hypothetical protein
MFADLYGLWFSAQFKFTLKETLNCDIFLVGRYSCDAIHQSEFSCQMLDLFYYEVMQCLKLFKILTFHALRPDLGYKELRVDSQPFFFPTTASRPALGPTQPPIQCACVYFSRGKAAGS